MNSISFSSLLFFCMISINYSTIYRRNPMIFITQGVIKKENVFPIHVSWYILNFSEGDHFSIYTVKENYVVFSTINSRTGSFELAPGALGYDESLDQYCVTAFTRENKLKNDITCESKVQWMYDRQGLLELSSLPNLIIPGTHHSAAYAQWDYESMEEQGLFSRWTLCQTKSIKSQLMDGIRYLDLRPSFLYKDGMREYLITHKAFNLVYMDEVVKQINEFMEISKDIVIVSFKEFWKGIMNQDYFGVKDSASNMYDNLLNSSYSITGFETNDDHRRFIKYLEHSFEKHAHPRKDWKQPLRDFWGVDKRLVLSYDHPSYETSNLTWPPIDQWWSDAQSINRLHSGLTEFYQNISFPYSKPHAAMVELTHSLPTIILDIFQRDRSLRHWGERVGRYIPQWYIEKWENEANIIAVDFYQTSGVVDLAIQLTENRLSERKNSKEGV